MMALVPAGLAGGRLDLGLDADATVRATVDGHHGISLELGRDGRVDAAILASLRYAPPSN